jgi:nicotinate phosphoribosyltransferase
VRLDSGDLGALARDARRILNDAGLTQVGIFVSGDLDEYRIAELVAGGAPVDGFGVGTRMGTSADAPYLNCAYKLVAYDGRPRMKLSEDKATLPCRKQVFRVMAQGHSGHDVLALDEEHVAGRPLLATVMRDGRRVAEPPASLDAARAHCAREIGALPAFLRTLEPQAHYPVEVSYGLAAERDHLLRMLTSG